MASDEKDEAALIVQQNSESVGSGIIEKLQSEFPSAKIHCLAVARGMTVRIYVDIEKDEPKASELTQFCDALESAVSYPELRLFVKLLD